MAQSAIVGITESSAAFHFISSLQGIMPPAHRSVTASSWPCAESSHPDARHQHIYKTSIEMNTLRYGHFSVVKRRFQMVDRTSVSQLALSRNEPNKRAQSNPLN
jgi:hypothetical protein